MLESEQSRELIARLERIRRIAYRRWILYGVTAVGSGGVYALLAILLVDWGLNLPAIPRLVIGGAFLVGFALAWTYWIYRPARAGLSVGQIAARIERYFGDFNDRLSSLVNFAQNVEAGSAPMVRQFLVNTERAIARRDLERVLTTRPLLTGTLFFILSVVLLAAVSLGSPAWMWTGLSRYLDPFGAVEWPTTVQISPLTRVIRAPLAESARVRMKVTTGLSDTLRGVVHLRDAEGRAMTLAMQREGDVFEAVIQPVLCDVSYHFEAGDASTRREPGRIVAVARPVIEEVALTVYPPAYADGAGPEILTLTTEAVDVIRGSRVEVVVTSSKDAARGAGADRMQLHSADGWTTPLTADPDDRRRLRATFEPQADVQFRVTVVDEDGFENRTAALYTLKMKEDMPPRVALTHPAGAVEATPQAILRLVGEAVDDFGVSAAALEATREDRATLSEPVTLEGGAAGGVRGSATFRHDWDLARLALEPGDVATFCVAAWDTFPGEAGPERPGRSASLTLRIISAAEYERRVRDQLHGIERQLRQVLAEQDGVTESAEALAETADWSEAERDAAASAASREARLARSVRDLVRRSRDLAGQMSDNRVEDEGWAQRVRDVADRLAGEVADRMSGASGALQQARDAEPADEARSLAAEARRGAAEASANLRGVLEELSRWGDVQELASRLTDLVERQEALRDATAAAGKETLGRAVESLTAEEQAELERLARQQEQLNDDVNKALAQMRDQSAGSVEAAARESLEQALREAAAQDLPRHLKTAAEAVRGNRTAAAGVSQSAAKDAMSKMVAGLREARKRELDELRKELERAEEQVAALLRRQEELTAAAEEAAAVAAPSDVVAALAEPQGQLRTNARWLGEDLGATPKSAPAGELVSAAAAAMSEAHRVLGEARAADAKTPQQTAEDFLHQALDALAEAAEQVRDDIERQTLEEIQGRLEALVAAQREIDAGIRDLAARLSQGQRIGRLESKAASDLARDQGELVKATQEAQAQVEEAPVFAWALQRVVGWMEGAQDRLTRRAIDGELERVSGRIVRELETLIAGLAGTQDAIKDPEFADDDGRGGGGDGASQQQAGKPVPTVTELLVLKAIQIEINERTVALAAELAGREPGEAELRRLRELGEDQAQVFDLTRRVTEAAREEQGVAGG
ncbi:MAG: hypothetical protein FLDDKLPJ_00899 [Phycisphaerae bacterium]|nr:hypothetical protein [Phycisphaerae bacterium]